MLTLYLEHPVNQQIRRVGPAPNSGRLDSCYEESSVRC